MIQGIFTFQFVLNQKETGEIEPEFRPIQLIFREDEESFTKDNYSQLISEDDIFATFYQHTTGLFSTTKEVSNFYSGRLRETPYQVLSYFRQESDGSQFIAISIFELDDEVELFEELFKELAKRLESIFPTLLRAQNSKQISLISNINIRLSNELKFAIFQIERLSRLDKLQKVALIYNTEERVKLLEILRQAPASKDDVKKILEKIKPTINIDITLRPFLELNLLRRDWSKGEKDKQTGIIKNQGEFLFLIKDVLLARVPNEVLINNLKETKNYLFLNYREKMIDFFANYDPYNIPFEETKKLASILLNPDIYDFFALMRNNYYPLDKIPKVFSDFAVTEILLDNLKKLNVITEIKDEDNRSWILLLTDIQPLVIFPEFILPNIRKAYKEGEEKSQISYEIAKKAYDLLEVTYADKVEF